MDARAMRLTALIFDLDGVIADTSDLHFQSWLQVTPEYGLLVDHALNDRLRSRSRRASLEIILAENGRELSESVCEDLMARKNQVYLQLLQGMDASALLPGVVPLIEEASAAGLRLAVGSASRNAEAVLRRTGIRDRFDLVVDGNRDLPSKPAPDLFLEVARQLATLPDRCLVIEDADVGIRAAQAAGMWSVGVGPVEQTGQAHVRFDSLEHVTLADVLAALAEAA